MTSAEEEVAKGVLDNEVEVAEESVTNFFISKSSEHYSVITTLDMTNKKIKTKTKTIQKEEEVEYDATQYMYYIDSFKAGQTFKLIFALKNSINYIPVHCSFEGI